MTSRRRFVAGAVCPACGEMDRTVLEVDAAQRIRSCVSCGYREVLEHANVPVPEGRFGRSAPAAPDVAPVAVRVLSSPAQQGRQDDLPGKKD
jgi:uncharacterized metal-binding protein (TIGR02443 family)